MIEDKRVDEGWKKRAREEKVKSSASSPGKEGFGPNDTASLPEISFVSFISGLTTQILMALGQVPHPTTGQKEINLDEAKYLIDTIRMLEAKTKNNLTPDEAKTIKDVLYNLQMAFVAMSKKV